MTVQTTLANNGKQMENLKQSVDATTTFCQTLAKTNAEASGKNMVNALEIQQFTPIDGDTMKEIQKIDANYMKEFKEKINKFQIEYKEFEAARIEFKENNKKRNSEREAIS